MQSFIKYIFYEDAKYLIPGNYELLHQINRLKFDIGIDKRS
jgi:hypothetical protein